MVFDRDLTSVTLLDNDEEHFAMDAKCCTEKTHPNNCWMPLSTVTWIVHHVSPKTIRCMFAQDVAKGLFQLASGRYADITALLNRMLVHDGTVRSALEANRNFVAQSSTWEGPLPDLCGCVVTPPAHPGMPLPTGSALTETSS